ncbi:MAG: hypothetical protein ACNS60_21155 [Candidatus Cyclobacteriaceae bacterium M2_1C_046]
MEKFNDLDIKGSMDDLTTLLNEVKENLPADWIYKEDNTRNYIGNTSEKNIICLESPSIKGRKGLVWFRIYEDKLTVINIVPTKSGSFEHSEYNAILDAFYKECVLPLTHNKSVTIEYNIGGIDVIELTGKDTYDAMVEWESSCNHSTGNTHPMDFKRWAKFVITAHRNKSQLTPSIFGRWLIEEKGWNENFDITHRLVSDYEYSLQLLEENDKY